MLDQILSFLFLYKYIALFFIAFFASIINITPASPAIIASGYLVTTGHLNYYYVFIAGYFGVVFGDIVAYTISYKYSRKILMKIGFKKILESENYSRIENIFKKNATQTIFVSRFFLTTLGPIVNVVAGLSRISWKKFIIYDALGEIIYISAFTGIGLVFANSWEKTSNIISYIMTILIITVLILIYLYIKKDYKKHLKKYHKSEF